MNHSEEKFSYKDLNYEVEYQYDDKLFYPIKISVNVPISNGSEWRPIIFSKISFDSKEKCVNFLIYETQKFIDTYIYNFGMCTLCNLCIRACPTDAIVMSQGFEHAVYDRNELIKTLNRSGSKVMEGVEEKSPE